MWMQWYAWNISSSVYDLYQLPSQGSRCVPRYLQALGAMAEDSWSGQAAHHGHHHDAADLSHQLGNVTSRLPRSLPPASLCGSGEINKYLGLLPSSLHQTKSEIKQPLHLDIETPTDRVSREFHVFFLCIFV